VRSDVEKASSSEAAYFHTYVGKILYLAKRVRQQEYTTATLTSTIWGIVLRIGEHMTVRAYIDAAYGVHTSSGKSHTGCAIVLGNAGALFCKSTKQKIVTKSSTEAELGGLLDTATQAIHMRNFV
jgi:hypothetical protein